MTAPLRNQFRASIVSDPDVIAFYGAVLEAASDLRCAGETVYSEYLMGRAPTDRVLAEARRAAERTLAAIRDYEAEGA